MQKEGPSIGRIGAMVIFALSCFGLLTFLWISFGGSVPLKPKEYQLKIHFPEATTLAEAADVRIAGVTVGKVRSKALDKGGNRTTVVLKIDPAVLAPRHVLAAVATTRDLDQIPAMREWQKRVVGEKLLNALGPAS